jgi:hypothetical protein
MSREEVAACVCATLIAHGIEMVLSGGAVAAIYSEGGYQSDDLDFIHSGLAPNVEPAMHELGFARRGRYWQHPDTRYWVEFPAGPLAIGGRSIKTFDERSTPFGVLRLLSPTHCVMDRLAAFYHWNDTQALETALAVAQRHPVDLSEIEAWSLEEGAERKFTAFRRRFEARDR